MLEMLQSLSRAVLALLSGALLIFGFFFLSDGVSGVDPSSMEGYGRVWTEIRGMLKRPDAFYVFVPITAVVAYVLGIVNVAVSSMLLRLLWNDIGDDLVLISEVEALQQPHLLKETLDVLHIERALVASVFPLLIVGIGLACDRYEWQQAPWVRIAAGSSLALIGILAPFLAGSLSRRLQKVVENISRKLFNGTKPSRSAE